MRTLTLALALLLAEFSAAEAQTTTGAPVTLPPGAETCYALAQDGLRVDPSRFANLQEAELLRRLERQVARVAARPELQAMLACILRKTAS